MGKLNIAHHKSYHPYRRDNIERVKRDEEEAKLKEAQEEGRIMLADSEARIDLLRQRSGVGGSDLSKKQSRWQEEREEQRLLSERTKLDLTSSSAALPTTGGHINFFQDLEQSGFAAAIAKKKAPPVSTDKGVPLAPSKEDLRPWYSSKRGESSTEDGHRDKESGEDKRLRDTARKTGYDPLTSINHQLSSHKSSGTSSSSTQEYDRFKRPEPPHRARSASTSAAAAPADSNNKSTPQVEARLARESSERERALALIRRRKREMMGSETPSTVHGGMEGEGYGDIFNKKEVDEARKRRERGHVYWEERESGSTRDRRSSLPSRRW